MAEKTKFKGGEANQFKAVSFTRDTALASGNQAVSGIGFKPTSVVFLMAQHHTVGEMSVGMDDGANLDCIWDRHNGAADTWGIGVVRSIFSYQVGGLTYSGLINSFDSDGFTIAWTRTGAPTGTLTVYCLVMR